MVLLHAATIAHIIHLQTNSFAQHMALDELYQALPDLADELIESYQGKYGIVDKYPLDAGLALPMDAVAFVRNLAGYVEKNRAAVAPDTYIQNIIDEITGQIRRTEYKLTNLS